MIAFFTGSAIGRAIGGVVLVIAAFGLFTVWLAAHDASIRREALTGYVLKSEADALQAQLDRERDLRAAADRAAAEARNRAVETLRAKQQSDAEVERLSEAAKTNPSLSRPTDGDREWIGKH